MTALVDWMAQRKLTQVQVGELIDRHHTTVGRYLSGERMPNRKTLAKLHKVTNGEVTANDFVGIKISDD